MWAGWVRDKRAVWGWGRGWHCVEGEGYVEMHQLVGWNRSLGKAVALGKDRKASDEG